MSTQFHAWHHVHVVTTDWHDAAEWHAKHTPAESIPWDHDKHRGYKSEMLRAGPNLVLVMEHQHSTRPSRAKIDSIEDPYGLWFELVQSPNPEAYKVSLAGG